MDEPLDARLWLALAISATSALADLHDRADDRGHLGFVHGDISPDNVFWETPDTITFVDFSSSTFRDAPEPAFPDARGSLPYVAPELARGEIAADAATDTYALAATLLALATSPIVNATTDAAALFEVGTVGISSSLPECRPDLPPAARETLGMALRFDRPERLTSALELSCRLRAARL